MTVKLLAVPAVAGLGKPVTLKWVAGLGLTVKLPPVSDVPPVVAAVMVKLPGVSIVKLLKVATPATAVTTAVELPSKVAPLSVRPMAAV